MLLLARLVLSLSLAYLWLPLFPASCATSPPSWQDPGRHFCSRQTTSSYCAEIKSKSTVRSTRITISALTTISAWSQSRFPHSWVPRVVIVLIVCMQFGKSIQSHNSSKGWIHWDHHCHFSDTPCLTQEGCYLSYAAPHWPVTPCH
jgi:hypothetical protein